MTKSVQYSLNSNDKQFETGSNKNYYYKLTRYNQIFD